MKKVTDVTEMKKFTDVTDAFKPPNPVIILKQENKRNCHHSCYEIPWQLGRNSLALKETLHWTEGTSGLGTARL